MKDLMCMIRSAVILGPALLILAFSGAGITTFVIFLGVMLYAELLSIGDKIK